MRFLTLISIICLAGNLQAWEVKKFRGDVSIERQGQSKKLELQQKLQEGDIIRTGKKARALLVEGQSKLWLGQKTVFKIQASKDKKTNILHTIYGKMRTLVAPKQAERYRYKFKTVVAGVRGTEFFAQSNESGDRLCTLEGEVAVEQEGGETVLIPAGKGVLFSQGEVPQLSDNSNFLVDRWVAETSFSSEKTALQSFYENQKRKHALGSNFYWGLTAWTTVCDLWNPDYRNSTEDLNPSCVSTYISPFLQYGKKHRVFVRPALNTYWGNRAAIFDDNPTTFGRQHEAITLAEGFFQTQWNSIDVKAGYQDIQWNDGILISPRRWSPEPTTYLALRTRLDIQDWKLDILAIDGDEKNYTLDGINQVTMLGLKLDLPKQWGNLFVLYADFPGFDSPIAHRLYHERELMNVGFYRRAKHDRLDYKVSTIYQNHSKLTRAARALDSGEGFFFDLEWGWTIPTSSPVRFSYRGLFASKDFAPIQNDYYILGISPTFRSPANMSQFRAKIEWQFAPEQMLFLEYLSTEQVDQNGFFTSSNVAKDHLQLGNEIDLVYNGKISESLKAMFGMFVLFPGSDLGPDPSSGLIGRLEFNY